MQFSEMRFKISLWNFRATDIEGPRQSSRTVTTDSRHGLPVYPNLLNEYGTFEDAYRNIWHFIEKVYNEKRLHSALDYRSPDQFELEVALNTVA